MSLPAISGRSDKIRQAATKERRSALYRWMLANFDDFKATVAEAGRPNWKALSEAFGTEGLLDRNGNTPSAEGARQTWFLARQAVAKNPALAGKPTAQSAPPAPPVRPIQPTMTPPSFAERTADERRRGNSFRRWNPATTDEDIERLVGKPKPKSA